MPYIVADLPNLVQILKKETFNKRNDVIMGYVFKLEITNETQYFDHMR